MAILTVLLLFGIVGFLILGVLKVAWFFIKAILGATVVLAIFIIIASQVPHTASGPNCNGNVKLINNPCAPEYLGPAGN